jgi:hypothetical protein
MGNGVLPNGPSYRAHPRLYQLGRPATSASALLTGAQRTSKLLTERGAVEGRGDGGYGLRIASQTYQLARAIFLSGYGAPRNASKKFACPAQRCVKSPPDIRSQKRAKSEDGDPDRIRTCDLWFRKPSLYPTELRGLFRFGALAHADNPITSRLTDLRFRKPLLYPAELRDRPAFLVASRAPRQCGFSSVRAARRCIRATTCCPRSSVHSEPLTRPRKPVPTPPQVWGRLFPENALILAI